MKARLNTVLKKNVAPWMFILTCALFVVVVATARVMAERVFTVQEYDNNQVTAFSMEAFKLTHRGESN